MQAVILAAGSSTRTYPLTLTRPKPLLSAAGKTILEHNIREVEGLVDEIILIVGYRDRQVTDFIKTIGCRISAKISYIEQKERLGTGHAASLAEHLIKDRFILMGGDDFFSGSDIRRVMKHRYAVLAQEVSDPSRYGVFVTKGRKVKRIVEKPKRFVSNLANTGLYVLDIDIFPLLRNLKKSRRGEYEVTDAISELAKKENVVIEKVRDYWVPIGYPWDLLVANSRLLSGMKKSISGIVDKDAEIHGNLFLGSGSRILPGTYIEGNVSIGRNCTIGPDAYLKGPVSVGDRCRIRDAEISNSVLFDSVKCGRKAVIKDSVVGSNVSLGDLTAIVSSLPENETVLSAVKGKLVDTMLTEFGTVMADSSSTETGTVIYPGRKVWPGRKAARVVRKDIN